MPGLTFTVLVWKSIRIDKKASRLLNYYGLKSEFDLPDIYRASNQFALVFYDLQRFVSEQVAGHFGRDLQYSFYDVTNYYTEKDFDKYGN